MADPTNTLYRDAVLGLVRYLEVEVGRSTDGANTPLRITRSVPSSEDGRQLFSPTNPASVTLGSAGAGLALDATLQTIAQGIASFAAANHVDLGALLTRLGQALTVQGTVNVGNLPATQAVSATALPLPAGAAKDTTVAGIVTALGSPLQAGGTVTATQSGAWTVALGAGAAAIGTVGVSSLPALPTGTNTIGSVNQAGSWTVALGSGSATIGTVNVQGGNTTAVQVAGGAAAGAAPVNPPLSISGVDGGGLKRHILTDATGRVAVSDSGGAPYSNAAAMTPGTPATAGRAVGINATASGSVTLTLSGSGTVSVPVNPGWQDFPFAVTQFAFANGATGTVYSLS